MPRRLHGTGSVVKRKDGRYMGMLRVGLDAHGKHVRRFVYGRTAGEVRSKLAELAKAEPQAEKATAKRPNDIRVATFIDEWLETAKKPTVRASTYEQYKSIINTHIVPHLGDKSLGEVTPQVLQALYRKLEQKKVTFRPREMVHVILKAAFDRAVKWERLDRNPVDAVDKPTQKGRQAKLQFYTEPEVKRLLKAAQDTDWYAFLALAVTMGLRQGELQGLELGDVSFKQGSITIRQALQEVAGHLTVGAPKTKASRRTVYPPKFVMEALVDHISATSKQRKMGGLDLLFPNSKGTHIRKKQVRHAFSTIVKKAELRHIAFKGLRHTAASLMLAKGVHPKLVQAVLGHSRISVTLDTYSHLTNEQIQGVGAVLDGLF